MRPIRVPLGEWLPDISPADNPGLTEAKNCLPVAGQYAQLGAFAATTNALSERVRGAVTAIDGDVSAITYAGTQTALYSLSGASWTDRKSGTYTTASDGYWKFAQYGDTLIATNHADAPQSIAVGGSAFAALGGSPPKARHIGVIRDFIFLGDLNVGGTLFPFRARWSAIGDPTDWPTIGSQDAADKQSGQEDLDAQYGPVMHIGSGAEFGLVFQQRGITRFTYTGGAEIFQVDTYEKQRGVYGPNSVAQVGGVWYFLGYDDFYATDGASVRGLGAGKVAKTFFAEFNQNQPERVTVSLDPQNKILVWSYPSTSSSDGTPDKYIALNYEEGRWTHGDLTVDMLFLAGAQAYTLEDLDAVSASIDTLPASLDSTIWMGGSPLLSGFSTSFAMGVFTGSALTATFATGEVAVNQGGRAVIQGIRPVVTHTAATITARVGYRDTLGSSVTYTSATSLNSRTQMANFRAEGRYARAEMSVAGGFSRASAMEILVTPQGMV